MDDSQFFFTLLLIGLLVWELYYIVSNFGWWAYIWITAFTIAQGFVRAALKG